MLASAVAVGCFLMLLLACWRGELSVRSILIFAIVAQLLAFAFLPVLYSRDVYGYAIYGRILSTYHSNPYVVNPSQFPGDPFFPLIGNDWIRTRSFYGPAFTLASAGIVRLLPTSFGTVMGLRFASMAATTGSTLLVAWSAKRLFAARAAFGVALVGLNPLVLFHVIAAAHNDAWVELSIAAALALLVMDRRVAAVAVLTLGLLVKTPGAVPLVILVSYEVGRAVAGRRLRTLAKYVTTVMVVALPFVIPFLQRTDPTLGQSQLTGHEGWISPTAWVRRVVARAGADLWAPLGKVGSDATRLVAALAIVAVLAFLIRALIRTLDGSVAATAIPQGSAWAWGLLSLTLLAPIFFPWYLAWTLPVAWLLPVKGVRLVAALSALQAMSLFAVESSMPDSNLNTRIVAFILAPVVIFLAYPAARDLVRRLRTPEPLLIDT